MLIMHIMIVSQSSIKKIKGEKYEVQQKIKKIL